MRWGKKQARKAILPSASVCMIEMMLVSGYLFKKTPENPLWTVPPGTDRKRKVLP